MLNAAASEASPTPSSLGITASFKAPLHPKKGLGYCSRRGDDAEGIGRMEHVTTEPSWERLIEIAAPLNFLSSKSLPDAYLR